MSRRVVLQGLVLVPLAVAVARALPVLPLPPAVVAAPATSASWRVDPSAATARGVQFAPSSLLFAEDVTLADVHLAIYSKPGAWPGCQLSAAYNRTDVLKRLVARNADGAVVFDLLIPGLGSVHLAFSPGAEWWLMTGDVLTVSTWGVAGDRASA